MAPRTSISSPAPRPFPPLPSRRRTLQPTRITLTRSSSTTTIPEPPQAAIPAYRSPATAVPLSPGLRRVRFVPATGPTLATQLLSSTNRPVLSLQWISLRAAADRASAPGSPLTAAPLGPLALALTTAALTTESLPTRITPHPLHFSGE